MSSTGPPSNRSRHRKFQELVDRDLANDPALQQRVKQIKQAMLDSVKLGRLREARVGTQGTMAREVKVSQIERGDDLYLSTLEYYIAELGDRLEIRAVFPDEVVELTSGDTRGDTDGTGQGTD